MRIRSVIVTLALAPVAILPAACGDEEDVGRVTDPSASRTAEPVETVNAEIEVGDFFFEPAVIEATLGDDIAVDLTNQGVADHTFTITQFVVDEKLLHGGDGNVTFTPDEAGEFTFFCRYHPGQMQGSLSITRPGGTPAQSDQEPSPTYSGGDGGFGY